MYSLIVIAACSLGLWAEETNTSQVELKETTLTSTVLTPSVDYFRNSIGLGASFGIVRRTDREIDLDKNRLGRRVYSVVASRVKAVSIFKNSELEGGVISANMSFGARSWEFFPFSFEIGLGSAVGMGPKGIGILELGYFLGTSATFQIGAMLYTPLATSQKPSWFQDWTVSVRFPLTLIKLHTVRSKTTWEVLQ